MNHPKSLHWEGIRHSKSSHRMSSTVNVSSLDEQALIECRAVFEAMVRLPTQVVHTLQHVQS
eukprot:2178520-Amphidinium_carterae.1